MPCIPEIPSWVYTQKHTRIYLQQNEWISQNNIEWKSQIQDEKLYSFYHYGHQEQEILICCDRGQNSNWPCGVFRGGDVACPCTGKHTIVLKCFCSLMCMVFTQIYAYVKIIQLYAYNLCTYGNSASIKTILTKN